jgi:hypothetical protein
MCLCFCYMLFKMVDYNTLKQIQLEKLITIKYMRNSASPLNTSFNYMRVVDLFGHYINTSNIINNSFVYYDNSIISNSLFVNYFNIGCKHAHINPDNTIYFNDFNVFIDMYVIINIIFINYFDIIIKNNVPNTINLNIDVDNYILVVDLCDKYNINISNIIKQINSISHVNKIELNINYDIYTGNIDQILEHFTHLLKRLPFHHNKYVYYETIKNFIIKSNNYDIISDLLVKLHNNNIVYDIYKNDFNKLFDDYILNKAFTKNHADHIKKTRTTEYSGESTYDIKLQNIKFYMNLNKPFDFHKFNTFIYDFGRYKELNYLIPKNINFTKKCDLINILYIKPKLLFQTITTDLYYTNMPYNIVLIKNLMKLSFHILYSMLNTDIQSFMFNKRHNFNIINSESPYIHKLSQIGTHLTTRYIPYSKYQYYNVFRYVEPITYGYCINLKHFDDHVSTKKIVIKSIYDNNEHLLLIPMSSPTLYNTPVNNHTIAYNELIEYTLGIFCKNFNYYPNYRPDKYSLNTPKITLTGSMIGEYCLSSYKNKNEFLLSDIDIGVLDPYLIYYVKRNIITNLNSLNNYNILSYKKYICRTFSHKFNNKHYLISKILSYIIKPNSNITYDLIFPNIVSKTVYYNVTTEINSNRLLLSLYFKYNIHNHNIKNNINLFLFNNHENTQNIKICLQNIYYYSSLYTLTKYRDIDIYISSLTKICLYHEPIVRACFTNGEFLIFTDCLNAIITRTSIDYRAVLGKKTPIDIMLKKHKQCVANRMFPNIRKLIDFITGIALSREIYITSDTINDIKNHLQLPQHNKKLIEINIDDYYIITIYTCYL